MTKKNQFGLSRKIPAPIARKIRQDCGFGCIVCGCIFVEYAHIDPAFADAKQHNPAKIKLMCNGCHGKFDSGLLAKERIDQAIEKPACKQTGFAIDLFDVGYIEPVLTFAGQKTFACEIPIEVKGEPVFLIKKPEEYGGPFRLSA